MYECLCGWMDDHAGVATGLSRIAAAIVDYQLVRFSVCQATSGHTAS